VRSGRGGTGLRALCGAAAVGAACVGGGPLPADHGAVEAALLARAREMRDGAAPFSVEGRATMTWAGGKEKADLGWALEVQPGVGAELSLFAAPLAGPVGRLSWSAPDLVQASVWLPGQAAPQRYSGALGPLLARALPGAAVEGEGLARLARALLVPGGPWPGTLGARVAVDASGVELDWSRRDLVLRLVLMRLDGAPVHLEARVRGKPELGCVTVAFRGGEPVRRAEGGWGLPREIGTTLHSCCAERSVASLRVSVRRIRPGHPPAPEAPAGAPRPLEELLQQRWLTQIVQGRAGASPLSEWLRCP